jgi:hypothetical protein
LTWILVCESSWIKSSASRYAGVLVNLRGCLEAETFPNESIAVEYMASSELERGRGFKVGDFFLTEQVVIQGDKCTYRSLLPHSWPFNYKYQLWQFSGLSRRVGTLRLLKKSMNFITGALKGKK